jgi:hypothetical protein
MKMGTHRLAAVAITFVVSQGTLVIAQQSGTATKAPAPAQKESTAAPAPDSKNVNADAAILADFKSRVDKYLSLKKQASGDAPTLKQTEDPAKIKAAQTGLANAIRERRADAKQGDIFTPEVAGRFRHLLSPTVKGEDGRDAKKVLKDDAPVAVPLKVNSDYPEAKTLPTVPAKMLLNLPTLPKGVEYRIVNKTLILRDADANIIVDFMTNAMP